MGRPVCDVCDVTGFPPRKKWCKINLLNVNLEVRLWSCTCPEPTLGISCTWGDVTVPLAQPKAVPWTQHHHFMFNLDGYPGSSYLAQVSTLCREEVEAQGYLAKCLTSGWLPNLPRRGPFIMLGPRDHDHNVASLSEHGGSYIVFWSPHTPTPTPNTPHPHPHPHPSPHPPRHHHQNVCIQVHVGWTAPVDQHGHQPGWTTLRFPPHYQQV